MILPPKIQRLISSRLSPPTLRQRLSRRAQTLVEYGIIIAMVSVVVILTLQALGESTQNIYEVVDNSFEETNSYNP